VPTNFRNLVGFATMMKNWPGNSIYFSCSDEYLAFDPCLSVLMMMSFLSLESSEKAQRNLNLLVNSMAEQYFIIFANFGKPF
jgi:hypothetical protein